MFEKIISYILKLYNYSYISYLKRLIVSVEN